MTKILIPIFQRAQDLRLAVVTQDVLPTTKTMQEANLTFSEWQVNFAIIGESHRIQIRHNGAFFLEEMLACIDIAADSCWHYHDFADLEEHAYREGQYRIQTYFSEVIPDKIETRQGIEYQFPKVHDIYPITRIEWQLSETILRWWTLHTYAEAKKITCVHTQSEFYF